MSFCTVLDPIAIARHHQALGVFLEPGIARHCEVRSSGSQGMKMQQE